MPQQLATIIFAFAIAALFVLVRQPKVRTSKALYIPVVWLLIGGSRNVGEWMQWNQPVSLSAAERYAAGNPLDRNILAAVLLLGVIVLVRRRRQVSTLLRANPSIFLYIAYCGLSILWADYPYVAFRRWNRALGDIIIVLMVLTERAWIIAFKQVFTRVSFLLVPISVLLTRYYPEIGRAYSEGRIFWTGVATDKNGLGMTCLVCGLACLSCFLREYQDRGGRQRKRHLIAYGTVLAAALWLIVKADSATAVACFLLGGSIMVLTSLPVFARKAVLIHVLALVGISVPLYALFLDHQGGLLQTLGRDPTLTGRTAVWQVVLGFVESPFFGTGFENFWLGRRLETILSIIRGLNQAHNGYLEVYLNLGWVGVILLGAIIVTGYRNVVTAFHRDSSIGPLRLAYFVVAIIYNLTEAGFKMMSPIWITFLLVSMAIPERKPRQLASQPHHIAPRPTFSEVGT